VRDGVILRLSDDRGIHYFGEAVTLPYFGTETKAESIQALQSLPSQITAHDINQIPQNCPATRFALECALLGIVSTKQPEFATKSLPVSFLLSGDQGLLEQHELAQREGYSTFKLKIGISKLEQEIALVESLLKKMEERGRLRLDANGGLSFEQACEWCSTFRDSNKIEFIEQPLAVENFAQSLELLELSDIPIALDESVATSEDLLSCYQNGWKGVFVVKVSRLRDLGQFLDWKASHQVDIVYSSALETSFGTELGVRIALQDLENKRALGYGVDHWFEQDGLYRHHGGPQLESLSSPETTLAEIWESLAQ
jgi:O-succinylbenzoate synthase